MTTTTTSSGRITGLRLVAVPEPRPPTGRAPATAAAVFVRTMRRSYTGHGWAVTAIIDDILARLDTDTASVPQLRAALTDHIAAHHTDGARTDRHAASTAAGSLLCAVCAPDPDPATALLHTAIAAELARIVRALDLTFGVHA